LLRCFFKDVIDHLDLGPPIVTGLAILHICAYYALTLVYVAKAVPS